MKTHSALITRKHSRQKRKATETKKAYAQILTPLYCCCDTITIIVASRVVLYRTLLLIQTQHFSVWPSPRYDTPAGGVGWRGWWCSSRRLLLPLWNFDPLKSRGAVIMITCKRSGLTLAHTTHLCVVYFCSDLLLLHAHLCTWWSTRAYGIDREIKLLVDK